LCVVSHEYLLKGRPVPCVHGALVHTRQAETIDDNDRKVTNNVRASWGRWAWSARTRRVPSPAVARRWCSAAPCRSRHRRPGWTTPCTNRPPARRRTPRRITRQWPFPAQGGSIAAAGPWPRPSSIASRGSDPCCQGKEASGTYGRGQAAS
jgi:hypothetical protein